MLFLSSIKLFLMKNKTAFSFRNRVNSFKYAFNGLILFFREEHNSWIHLFLAFLAVFFGFFFKISMTEWLAIIFAIGFVFVAEIINTAIENLSDFVSKEKHESIKHIKDLAAAGVLVSAFTALVIGAFIFIPKLYTEYFS